MADFTIASRIGQGVGQNAFAGGGSQMNPLNMMQLMQTMELQRAAEQRALAGEARAQAMHVPQLGAANLRLQEAEMDLKKKQRDADLSAKYTNLWRKYDNPFDDAALKQIKSEDPELYSIVVPRKLEQDKLLAETKKLTEEGGIRTTEGLIKGLELNKQAANLWGSAITNGLVNDQKTYSAMRKDLLRGQENLATLFPEEYSPEAVQKFQQAFAGTKKISTMSMAGGNILVLVDDKPYGLVDPTFEGGGGAMKGVRPFGPGEAPAVPNATPTDAQPRAAAPQTMQFSGMGQLAPAGQQAAQTVMSAFPGARITSGYRSPQKNTDVGGAPRSYHLTGNAIDVVPPAGMPMNVFAAQLRAQLEPMGYTVMYGDPGHLDHVHIQPGNAMNVPRAFSPSVAATDVAAGRQPMGMMAPANAMAPLAAMSLMQQQNALAAQQQQPQALPDIAPGLTQAAPAAPVAPRREDYATYGQFVKAQEDFQKEQADIRKEERAAERAAKPKQLTPVQEKKLRDDIAGDYSSAQATIATMEDVLKSVDQMRKIPDSDKDAILGRIDANTPVFLPSSIRAQNKLDNLRGQITAMGKAATSLTGAIGNMAVQEWQLVADQIAAIDPSKLDAKTLNEQLDLIEAKAKGTVARIKDAYRRQYQEEFERFGDRFKLPEDDKRARTVVKRGKEQGTGRAVVQYSDGTVDYAD